MKRLLLLIWMLVLLTSCVQDIEYDKANDISFEPVIKVALAHFNSNALEFNSSNTRIDFTAHQAFNNVSESQNVEKIELLFEIGNSFDKDFTIKYEFLDIDLNQVAVVEMFSAQNSSLNKTVTYENTELESLMKTRAIRTTITISDANGITSDMFLKFKSAANIYLRINTNEV